MPLLTADVASGFGTNHAVTSAMQVIETSMRDKYLHWQGFSKTRMHQRGMLEGLLHVTLLNMQVWFAPRILDNDHDDHEDDATAQAPTFIAYTYRHSSAWKRNLG